jgi:two-component system phosphate regulon sensor histidine kinase PhoR
LKRTIVSVCFILTLAALFCSAFVTVYFNSREYTNQVGDELGQIAYVQSLIKTNGNYDAIIKKTANNQPEQLKYNIQYITQAGDVISSSDGSAISYANYSEFQNALKDGSGENIARGLFTSEVSYAIKLTDGNILRLSASTNIFSEDISPVILSILFGLLIFLILLPFFSALLFNKITKKYNQFLNILKSIFEDEHFEPIKVEQDDISVIYRDINVYSKQIAQQIKFIKEGRRRIEYLLDSMNEGLVVVDWELKIIIINKNAAEYFDVGLDVKGQNLLRLTHLPTIIEAVNAASLSGAHQSFDIQGISDSNKILQIFVSPIQNEIALQVSGGAVLLITDVTSVRKTEQIRSDFVANASHELKTPLTTIKGFAELLDSDMITDKEKTKDYLKLIKDESDRLILLINDILKLSELESKSIESGTSVVSLKMIAEKVKKSLDMQADEKQVTVTVTGDTGSMEADADRIMQMFINLIDNAIKYNKPNGSVDVSIQKNADHIKVIVADTGVGIPKESQKRVFERFYRVEQSRNRKQGGTGLGLAIVKHIVGLYKGTIEVESELNSGTKMIISFPVKL